jgi:hypothetical protein
MRASHPPLLLLATALLLIGAHGSPVPTSPAPTSPKGQEEGGIDRVHVVWMNHLDVGFTNNIASVLNIYIHEYFTKAIATAKAVNKPGEPPVFVYTSHAWLLDIFLNCPRYLGLQCPTQRQQQQQQQQLLGVTPDYEPGCVVCPNASLVRAVEQGIRDDIITWHAFPFNAEPELADAGLLLSGIDAVRALDKRFGKANKTVISQRDVPGVTRGIVPLMAERGVKAFSEGCNAQIEPPQVPPIFNWTDEASGSSIVMMLHPRGYGVELAAAAPPAGEPVLDIDGEVEGPPQMCPGLQGSREFGLNDVVQIAGFNEALVYAFKSDNQGPPDADEVATILRCIRNASGVGLFPGSSPQVVGSTYDAFVAALLAHPTAAASLPVVTSEIGDTWIYGSQSDPKKMKLLRLMMRARSACTDCDLAEPALRNFSRLLLKPTEHTFGLHGLGRTPIGRGSAIDAWDNQHLQAALADHSGNETQIGELGEKFRQWEDSWVEQRVYPEYALDALRAPHASASARALGERIEQEVAAQWPVTVPNAPGKRTANNQPIQTTHFTVTVSNTTGGLSSLIPRRSPDDGVEEGLGVADWVDSTSGYDMFQLVYRSLNQQHDFTPFRNNFTGDWQTFSGTWFKNQPGGCYDKQNVSVALVS